MNVIGEKKYKLKTKKSKKQEKELVTICDYLKFRKIDNNSKNYYTTTTKIIKLETTGSNLPQEDLE